MCVIAKGLGCLLWLAHAARRGFFVKRLHIWAIRSRQKTTIQKMAIIFPETQLSTVRIAKRIFRPAGRHLQGKRKSVPQTNTSAT